MWLYLFIIGGILCLDLLSKFLVYTQMEVYDSVVLIPEVLSLTYVQNKGAGWGLFADRRWIFLTFSAIALVALSVYLFRFCKEPRLTKIALSLVIGGGLSNMVDRLGLGYVVDMIHLTFIDFPVFNVADSCITVGSFLLIFCLVVSIVKEEKQKNGTK